MSTTCVQPQTTFRELLDNAEEARDTLDAFKLFLETANPNDIGHQDYNALILYYEVEVANALNDIELLKARMEDLVSALAVDNNPSATLDDYEDAIALFEITLSVADGIDPCQDLWEEPEDGIRVKEMYRAIHKIILKIASALEAKYAPIDNDYDLLGIVQFIDTFGGTVLEFDEYVTPIKAYAITATDGSKISLYNNPSELRNEDVSRNFPLHTAENLVHEFGHVLDFKHIAVYNTWQTIRSNFSRDGINFRDLFISPIDFDEDVAAGWSNVNKRENRILISEFTTCTSTSTPCLEYEKERIADMFLFWVMDDTSNYGFDINNSDQFIADFAIAMQNFGEDMTWTRSNNVSLSSDGFLNWIQIQNEE